MSPRTRSAVPLALGVALLGGAMGCGSTAPEPAAPLPPAMRGLGSEPAVALADADERALLLLLIDRQIYERFVVHRALEGGVELRRELARALGRSGSSRGRPVLERLLGDADAEVRRRAAFALGELEEPEAAAALRRAAAGPDRPVALLAVEALAKLGVPLREVLAALADRDDREVAERLLPSLWRFEKRESLLPAARWLGLDDPELRPMAAYALARGAIPDAAVHLRALLTDPDPWIRGWAARGLGGVGSGADLAPMLALLADSEASPVIQALRAGARLVAERGVEPPVAWRAEIERLLDDPRSHVRLTAIEAAGGWLPDDALAARLVARYESGTPWERQAALLALADAGEASAADLTRRAAADSDSQLRRRSAAAAVTLDLAELVLALLSDPHPAVRADATRALLGAELRPGREIADLALSDPAAPVRVAALDWLAENPVLGAERLVEALPAGAGEERIDLELAAVRALEARAGIVEGETVTILQALETLGNESDFLVRREVARVLVGLGVSPFEIGPATLDRDLEAYRQILETTARRRWVRLETERGAATLVLECPTAPLTCLSFLQLAEQGFYDGQRFHRVVADFVVQAGDPTGGGWGGPGYTLRDEINQLRYGAGVLGMAHAGADTAGSQFFITLSPQPHLDGGYTAFGRVVAGFEVLLRIEQEDRLISIREVEAPGGGEGSLG